MTAVLALLVVALPAPASAQDAEPNVSITWPETYMTARPSISGRSDVSGRVVSDVTVTVRDLLGTVLAEMHASSDYGSWGVTWPADAEPLEHGEQYDIHVRQAYSDGRRGADHRATVDARAPDFTITEAPPEETKDRTINIAGTANLEPGDRPYVYVTMIRMFGGDWWNDPYAELPIKDGRFGGELAPAVPGEYKLAIGMSDESYQSKEVRRRLVILEEPKPPAEQPLPPPVEVLATPPPATVPPEQVVEVVAGVRRSAIVSLRRAGLETLANGRVRIPVEASVPGRLSVQLFAATKKARSAAARRALAQAAQVLVQPGTGALTLRPDARARRALKKMKRARLTIRVRFAPLQGAPLALETPLTLRR